MVEQDHAGLQPINQLRAEQIIHPGRPSLHAET